MRRTAKVSYTLSNYDLDESRTAVHGDEFCNRSGCMLLRRNSDYTKRTDRSICWLRIKWNGISRRSIPSLISRERRAGCRLCHAVQTKAEIRRSDFDSRIHRLLRIIGGNRNQSWMPFEKINAEYRNEFLDSFSFMYQLGHFRIKRFYGLEEPRASERVLGFIVCVSGGVWNQS